MIKYLRKVKVISSCLFFLKQSQPAQASPSSGKQSGNSERKRKEPREKDKEKEKEKNSCVIL